MPAPADLLDRELTAWLCTVAPDGTPHAVPVWYVRAGQDILTFAAPSTRKVRNLRSNPRCVLHLPSGDPGRVVIIHGQAELLDQPTAEVAPAAYWERYAALMALGGWTRDGIEREHTQAIRIRPERILHW